MGFNYGLEKKNFDSQWAMTRKQYEDAGMSSEAIQAMYDFDWSVFNANRSYQNHTQEMAAPSFEQSEESYSPLMDKYQKAISVTDHYCETKSCFTWIGEIENERLLAQIVLKEADLADQQNRIDALQLVLANQEKELSDYQAQIADILGVRTRIVQELSAQLASARISATVDEKTGDIVLDSSLMFETGSSTLKAEGLAQLNRLIPVYLGVLLQDEYRDYVAEIIIEGHTDSTGSYEHNLELSQNRALNVAKYCLNMGTLTQTQKTRLKSIITAQGRSFSDPVYDENGVEDQERSRRVEIKFRLKDAEMIQRMNSILSSME